MVPTEAEYKAGFRKIVGGWSEAYETRSGGGFGYPDLQFLAHVNFLVPHLVPIELKVGWLRQVDEVELLQCKPIRPSQITWHHNFRAAGGYAFVAVCSGSAARMSVWVIPSTHREVVARWREGWHLADCVPLVRDGKLVLSLEALLEVETHRRLVATTSGLSK